MKYVKWERVQAWKARVRREGVDEEEAYPYSFGSGDKASLGLAGSVLWLFTLPNYRGYRLAPSLVARLQVADVGMYDGSDRYANVDPEVRASGVYIMLAERDDSAYFPLNNLFHTLLQLEFQGRATSFADSYGKRNRSREASRGPYYTIAGHFRRHRWLSEKSVPLLEAYARAVLDGRRAFLSYKRSDFPPGEGGMSAWPEQLGTELAARGISCWWDRWNLPQADAREDPSLATDLLHGLLDDAVQQAVWFIALVGPDYLAADDRSWPRQEWLKAGAETAEDRRRHPMQRIAVFFSESRETARHDRWVTGNDRVLWVGETPAPDEVADQIASEVDAGRGS